MGKVKVEYIEPVEVEFPELLALGWTRSVEMTREEVVERFGLPAKSFGKSPIGS